MGTGEEPDIWRRVADAVGEPIWVLGQGWRVVAANAAAARWARRAGAEETRGHVLDELVGPDWRGPAQQLADGGGQRVLRLPELGTGEPVELLLDAGPSGLIVRLRPLPPGVPARLEGAILDAVSDGIYGVDAANRLTFANASVSRLLGYPPEQLLGRNSHALLHHTRPDGSPYPEQDCPLMATLRDGQRRDDAGVLWRADGTPLPVEYHAAPIVEAGRVVGAVVSFRDRTDELAAAEARVTAATAVGALHELQQVLQPPPPATADPELGVCYLPADLAGAGGDLYDWQSLPDDGLHLCVVDVMGKGLLAARDALAVTHALRLLALARTPLEQLVRQGAWLLADAYPELVATALLAHYHQPSGRLRLVSAGHPPPLLVAPDGTTRYLEAAGRPIGWPGAGTDDVAEVVVEPGARVVFYTDGLVEARRDVLAGMDRLAELATAARDLDPAAAARRLVTEVLSTAERRDDCLALVLSRPPRA